MVDGGQCGVCMRDSFTLMRFVFVLYKFRCLRSTPFASFTTGSPWHGAK